MAAKIGTEASSSRSSRDNRGESVVADVGRRRSSCGYCRSSGRTSVAHGLWAHSITADDYQDLLDRGWRRSGVFLYKPEMERTCCPSYTIRLKACDFIPSKEQTRVTKKMQRFLEGVFDDKKSKPLAGEPSNSSSAVKEITRLSDERSKEEDLHILSQQLDNVVHTWATISEIPPGVQLPKASIKRITHNKRKLISGSEGLLYTCSISFQIAANIKRSVERNESRTMRPSTDSVELTSEISPNVIAEKLAGLLNQHAGFAGLVISPLNGHLNFYCDPKLLPSGKKAEVPVGADGSKHNHMVNNSKHPHKKRRRLEIHLKRSSFDPEEYDLYRRYQIRVHNDAPDQVSESSYRRFLVDTPIVFVPPRGDGTVPSCGFGSFHQQYVIDGKLVAVGVVDILPRCLSSKYLFWDPDLASLSLGKYTALQEIGWVKENQAHCSSLQYYYLGYYIHSCSKMRYKAAYRPSELLCPKRYQWVNFDIARPLLDKKPYVVLSDFATLQSGESSRRVSSETGLEPQLQDSDQEDLVESPTDEDLVMMEPGSEGSEDDSDPEMDHVLSNEETVDGDVNSILIGLKNIRMRFKDIQHAFGSGERRYLELQLLSYKKAVGPVLSERMVYSLG
ncbi:hypothetical protein Scep_005626 [Stephania cephalantha]|uniref:Arginyl-tRNA--protein transferase n=1 Tax=Stephania cephalantha TaxID=152367 RepID=A0AAP0PWJ8_9MAGN